MSILFLATKGKRQKQYGYWQINENMVKNGWKQNQLRKGGFVDREPTVREAFIELVLGVAHATHCGKSTIQEESVTTYISSEVRRVNKGIKALKTLRPGLADNTKPFTDPKVHELTKELFRARKEGKSEQRLLAIIVAALIEKAKFPASIHREILEAAERRQKEKEAAEMLQEI